MTSKESRTSACQKKKDIFSITVGNIDSIETELAPLQYSNRSMRLKDIQA